MPLPTPEVAQPKVDDEPHVPGGYVVKEMSETKEKSAMPFICGTAAFHAAMAVNIEEGVKAASPEESPEVKDAINKFDAMAIAEAVEPEVKVHSVEGEAIVGEKEVEPEQNGVEPPKPIYVPSTLAVTPLDICSWVRHQTMGPGCTLPPGAEFTKTWRMKHFANGSEFDFEELRLVLKSRGDCGEACENVNVVLKKDDIKNDDEIEVSIHGLRVPDTPGQEVLEQWRFEDENGVQYGQPLRLRSVA